MKVYISADIEGITGIDHWDEATIGQPGYELFREQMTREVIAACEGSLAAGATHITVKDAHDSGRNLIPDRLPEPVQLIRGWSGHPYCMVQELDRSYDALILIGYHSPAGSGANPLAHTYTTEVSQIRLNGQRISEFHLVSFTAAHEGIPVVFLAGDADLCAEAKAYDPTIQTVITHKGIGQSVIAQHPQRTLQAIREGVEGSLRRLKEYRPRPLPEHFLLEVDYKEPSRAYRKSFYPGCQLVADATVHLQVSDWFEVLRALEFIVLT
ncbi:M55 family metallopeptidase [Thermostichus vulcanus]|uniref:M55 family metallopeptidase n=1 Tax=Thermostichus vulcanus str. 'Rupite' TaxID=2813851 RepID=A0ABT0CD99_THEVL|nr:M55 family metallopeptidase [Thermostichus vulcanus]MCJ2543704.1 M55 family metallopeptidase [Thermostichus vulcanus str. 'Rupite']